MKFVWIALVILMISAHHVSSQHKQDTASNSEVQVLVREKVPLEVNDITPRDWWEVSITVIALLVTAFGVYLTAGFRQRRRDRIAEIENTLNTFYRPLILSFKISDALHEILRNGKGDDFRTLPALVNNPNIFSKTDRIILGEIIEMGRNIEEIVKNQSGCVTDDRLVHLLSLLVVHLRMIRLAASDKKLEIDLAVASKHVYPREINKAIIAKEFELTAQLDRMKKSLN